MENNANNQNLSPQVKPQPIRWGYIVAAIIVIAIVVLAEMFHPRSTRNQIRAYEAQIEALIPIIRAAVEVFQSELVAAIK